jgi:hypothetical protein
LCIVVRHYLYQIENSLDYAIIELVCHTSCFKIIPDLLLDLVVVLCVCARTCVWVHVCVRVCVCACRMCIYYRYSFKLHGVISHSADDVIESSGNAYTTCSVNGFRQHTVRVSLPPHSRPYQESTALLMLKHPISTCGRQCEIVCRHDEN